MDCSSASIAIILSIFSSRRGAARQCARMGPAKEYSAKKITNKKSHPVVLELEPLFPCIWKRGRICGPNAGVNLTHWHFRFFLGFFFARRTPGPPPREEEEEERESSIKGLQ
jgi:hypothetical protein